MPDAQHSVRHSLTYGSSPLHPFEPARMNAKYREYLQSIRQAFPQPVSDRFHDSYFVFSIMRALEHVDELKSEAPILGQIEPCDMNQASQRRIEPSPKSLEEVIPQLVDHLKGMFIWGHPRSQVNVVPPPTIPSIIGVLLTTIYNPNLTSEENSRRVAVAEVEAASMTAAMLGYDPQKSTGLFTFGGTGTNLYAAKIGLEKALPGTIETGLRERAVLIASGQSHYCRLSIAGWLGLGEENVVGIPTSLDNAMKIDLLEEQMHLLLKDGVKIACIVATMGTTDAFGIDDLAAIVALRDRLRDEYQLDYTPHVHADAVIGWAWSVFNDYDFEENALEFRPRTVKALAQACHRIRHIHLADSVGIDFHKTGFAPYISSLFLAKDRSDLQLISRAREKMPYLFQSGDHHPGTMTLETSRSGAGPMAALASLLLLGKDGLRTVLGHVVEMSEVLREELEGHPTTTVLNADNVGAVTLFRSYPDSIDSFTIKQQERCDESYIERLRLHNEFNRRVFERLREDALTGNGVFISLTDCYRHTDYGEPINALKSYILSPFADEENVRMVVDKVVEASRQVQLEMQDRLG